MVYSDVVKAGLILPRKSKYTMRDVHAVVASSLFAPLAGRTLTLREAAFVVRCSALHHGTDYAKPVAVAGTRMTVARG